jgi:hypothetical protein
VAALCTTGGGVRAGRGRIAVVRTSAAFVALPEVSVWVVGHEGGVLSMLLFLGDSVRWFQVCLSKCDIGPVVRGLSLSVRYREWSGETSRMKRGPIYAGIVARS